LDVGDAKIVFKVIIALSEKIICGWEK